MAVDRRGFCRIAGFSLLGLAGAGSVRSEQPEAPAATDTSTAAAGSVKAPSPATTFGTVAEPLTGKRWAMVVDLQACRKKDGCRDCIAACHRVHNVPDFEDPKDAVKWIWKEPFAEALSGQGHDNLPHGMDHEETLVFCNHCDNPPCVRVCPTQATWKRDDGIVMMDWHRCIGCRYCVAGCPYGSRSFNWRDPRPHIDEIDPDFPTRTRGVVEKCTFCDERLAKGMLPACVEACESGCMSFGDLEDAGSPVRRLLAERFSLRRKPGLGTQPEVYYLV
jgi:molybdopterin-containing oxidoreductase family iron-sulfur binding subunit